MTYAPARVKSRRHYVSSAALGEPRVIHADASRESWVAAPPRAAARETARAEVGKETQPMPRYVTIGTLTLSPGMRALAEGIADQGESTFRQMPGNISVTFFLNEETNVYGAVSIWESREAAEQADAALTPPFEQAFGDALQGNITTNIYEIYEPNSRG
jgi:heme-degrading monooxygenase HmoA